MQRRVFLLSAALALLGVASAQTPGTFTIALPQLSGGFEDESLELAPGECTTTRAFVQNPTNSTLLIRLGLLQRAEAGDAAEGAGPAMPAVVARVSPTSAELGPNQTAVFTLEACAFPSADTESATNITLDVLMFPPGASAGQMTIRAHVASAPAEATLPAAAWLALGGIAAAGATWTLVRRLEWLRYAWLLALAPLYTRLAPSRLLEQEKRETIFRLIEREPGIHFSGLLERTGLPNGVLVHHLRQLERHRLVASRREGAHRRFAATPAAFPPPAPKPLTPMQARVLDLVTNAPLTQREIAEALGLTQQGANRHVKALERRGLLAIRYQDGLWRCHPTGIVEGAATTVSFQS